MHSPQPLVAGHDGTPEEITDAEQAMGTLEKSIAEMTLSVSDEWDLRRNIRAARRAIAESPRRARVCRSYLLTLRALAVRGGAPANTIASLDAALEVHETDAEESTA